MATITISQYNDDGTTSRSAGETLTINGATFTQRTDTRWHTGVCASAYADILPSSTLGGNFVIDATQVRWLPISGGSGTVVIGTTISQGSVSGYFLAAYASLSSAPTSAIPANGFIKFRSVSGGNFIAGALTGVTAGATGSDVTGWLEVVMDAAAGTDINIARLNEFRTSGDWFKLSQTNGLYGQQIQVPTNGGGVNTHCPGIWVETGVNTSAYEYYPSLLNNANGWNYNHIGSSGLSGVGQDARQKFVKTIGSGLLQFGENITSAVSYTSPSLTGTYTWTGNVVVVTSTAHGLRVNEQVYLDFTTGGATSNDGVYPIYFHGTNTFSVILNGSGAAGNVTVRARSTVSTTTGANTLAIGNLVYLDFTTGGLSAKSGAYHIETVPTTSAFTVNTFAALSAVGVGTMQMTIGYIPISGLNTRIPNILLRQCATASRNLNAIPAAAIADRPEFITSNAGIIKMEYCYGDWYFNFAQPYYIKIKNCATFDQVIISECATRFELDGLNTSMHGALDLPTLSLASNFAGGIISNGRFERGNTPAASDHAISVVNCNNLTFNNIQAGIIQYPKNTGYSFNITTCDGIILSGCRSINSALVNLASIQNTEIYNLDWCDRYMGYTNATNNSYCVVIPAGCLNIKIDGITFGFNGTIINCHPYFGIISVAGSTNCTFRNFGTRSSMLKGGTVPLYCLGSAVVFGGNNNFIKMQRIYIESLTTRAALYTDANNENNVTKESCSMFQYRTSVGTITDNTLTPLSLNSYNKGIGYSLTTTTGQTSIYGNHWSDIFTSATTGRILVGMNEPTSNTNAYNTLVLVGSLGGFTSTGSLTLQTSGDSFITECPYYIKGHTSLANIAPTINGTNVSFTSGSVWGSHSIYYQIDTSGSWNGNWQNFNQSTLSAETISATGFKLKYKIDCTSASSTNLITYITIYTGTTSAAQANNLYDLDTNTIRIYGLVSGSEVRAYYGTNPSTTVELAGIELSTTEFTFSHSVVGDGYIKIFALGYQPIEIPWTYSAEDKEIPVQPNIDRVFSNLVG